MRSKFEFFLNSFAETYVYIREFCIATLVIGSKNFHCALRNFILAH